MTLQYLTPGVYLGEARERGSAQVPAQRRLPCLLGRGSRLSTVTDASLTRAYILDAGLEFPDNVPYQAQLEYASDGNKLTAILSAENGDVIPSTQWDFVEMDPVGAPGVFDGVLVNAAAFDRTASYVLDYQSSDRSVLDVLPFDALREIRSVGDRAGESRYEQQRDYRIVTEVSDPVRGESVADTLDSSVTPDPGNTGGGVITVSTTTQDAFLYPYGRTVQLTVSAVAAPLTTFSVEASDTNPAGRQSSFNTPIFSGDQADLVVNSNSPLGVDVGNANGASDAESGLFLDFDFTVPFAIGDVFTVVIEPASLFELPGNYANTSNIDQLSDIAEDPNNAGTGTVTYHAEAEYGGDHDRMYIVRAGSAVAGAAATATLTCVQANVLDGGTFYVTLPGGAVVGFEFDSDATMANPQNMRVDLTGVASDGDLRDALLAAMQNSQAAVLNPVAAAAADITVTWPVNGTYPNTATNLIATGVLTSIVATPYAGGTDRSITMSWVAAGDAVLAEQGTAVLTDPGEVEDFETDFTVAGGVRLVASFGAGNFADDDAWTFSVDAGRTDSLAMDNREVLLTVSSITRDQTQPGQPISSFVVNYSSNTPEGGFGNLVVTVDGLTAPKIELPDQVTVYVYNHERIVVGDQWVVVSSNTERLDWSLIQRATEEVPAAQLTLDTLGNVTGTPGLWYMFLADAPTRLVSVAQRIAGVPPTVERIPYNHEAGTALITFNTQPQGTVLVSYEHLGLEPPVGGSVLINATRLRSEDEYNRPIIARTLAEAIAAFGPMTTDNDVLQVAELAFENGAPAVAICQVKDLNDDGLFTDADYLRALTATEHSREVTDICPINRHSITPAVLVHIAKVSHETVGNRRVGWFGAPRGMVIGSAQEAGTLVHLAGSMQVGANSRGLGRYVLVGNTSATRVIELDGGQATVEHDGSFIAAVLAARNASFEDPGETLLRKTLVGYRTIQDYEKPDLKRLGAASILPLTFTTANSARIEESITVHSAFGDEYHQISARCLRDFVTTRLEDSIDATVIGSVPAGSSEAEAAIYASVVPELRKLVANKIIAPYGSEATPPTIREIEVGSDVKVFYDPSNPTEPYLSAFFNLRYPIVRVPGITRVRGPNS